MIEAVRPGFLWAGLLLAGVPVLLHLLRPRERSPRLLPTARFLTPDPRRRIRFHRLPDRPWLLALRMGLCVLLGAAFAGLHWVGPSSGVGVVAVVDGGGAWAPPAEGELRGMITEAMGREPGALVVVMEGVPGHPEVRLGHLLRALRDEAGRIVGVDSLQAVLVARPRWDAWGPGTAQLREEVWPGAVRLVVPHAREEPLGAGPDASDDQGAPEEDAPELAPPRPAVHLRVAPELEEAVTGALESLGHPVTGEELPVSVPSIELRVGSTSLLGELWEVEGAPGGWWEEDPEGGEFLLPDGRVVRGAGPRLPGIPAGESTVPLLRRGGGPAAAAVRSGETDEGCRVALPLDPEAPVVESGELSLLLEALLESACGRFPESAEVDPGALKAWRELLEGGDRPETVEAVPLRRAGAGRDLTRLLMALALLLAGVELLRTRRLERRGEENVPWRRKGG